MDDSFLMRGFESPGNLTPDVECLVRWDAALFQSFRKRPALDKFEDKEPFSFVLLQSADCGDVGMIRRCEQLCLRLTAGQPLDVV